MSNVTVISNSNLDACCPAAPTPAAMSAGDQATLSEADLANIAKLARLLFSGQPASVEQYDELTASLTAVEGSPAAQAWWALSLAKLQVT